MYVLHFHIDLDRLCSRITLNKNHESRSNNSPRHKIVAIYPFDSESSMTIFHPPLSFSFLTVEPQSKSLYFHLSTLQSMRLYDPSIQHSFLILTLFDHRLTREGANHGQRYGLLADGLCEEVRR
jgi:hypothetical protein